MPAVYQNKGIRFLFPENWSLEEQQGEGQWSVNVLSPETAFWSLTVDEHGRSPEELVRDALRALQEEYPLLDATAAEEPLGRWKTVGHDLGFFCLDLTNTGKIRAFRAGKRSLLLLFQANDHEWARIEKVFLAISLSLTSD